jgi:hypothetical protein
MPEIINCPSCQRKLQVPEQLLGQDVQCPTCGATLAAAVGGPAPQVLVPTLARAAEEPYYDVENQPPRRRERQGRLRDDYDEDDDDYEDRRYRRRDLLPHRGSTVLVLGILSLVLMPIIICAGLVLGPIAWIMGQHDLADMRAGRMDRDGQGSTNAGRICGMIATILCIVIVVGVAILWIFFLAAAQAGRRW